MEHLRRQPAQTPDRRGSPAACREQFAPGGLLRSAQESGIPGNSSRAGALGCYWRDGQPVWRDVSSSRNENENPNRTHRDARGLPRTPRPEQLELDPTRIMTAYEDSWYHLWRERKLPSNVDPLRSNLADPIERDRLARIFRQGLDRKVGFACPAARGQPLITMPVVSCATPSLSSSPRRLPDEPQLPWTRCPGPPRPTTGP
ncbi:MAG: transglutaminase family protein [Kiritimatiellia bacterium]